MRHKIVSVTQAKAKLLELVRKVEEEGQAFLLTKDGAPVSALVPLEDYESLQETIDILADKATMEQVAKALKDERAGRLWKRDKDGKWKRIKKNRKVA